METFTERKKNQTIVHEEKIKMEIQQHRKINKHIKIQFTIQTLCMYESIGHSSARIEII